MTRMTGPDCAVMCSLINTHTHTQTHTHFAASDERFSLYILMIPPWKDQCEWLPMTRATGPDCAVMCSLINKHTHTHTHTHRKYEAHARCSRRNNPCQDVSLHGTSGSTGAPNVLCPLPKACTTHFLSSSQCPTVSLSSGLHNEALVTTFETATKLLTSPQFFYSRRVDALTGRDAMTSTQEEN